MKKTVGAFTCEPMLFKDGANVNVAAKGIKGLPASHTMRNTFYSHINPENNKVQKIDLSDPSANTFSAARQINKQGK